MMGLCPLSVVKITLPELRIQMRGWQRANGINPDAERAAKAMSRSRFLELAERYK
ncbi:hypothetical protein [Kordiimonas sp.]|uniref:hypothetical protein n=1 Tax=Kordiimonas sp. TaxID=1970157 RepID=UPI003A930D1C